MTAFAKGLAVRGFYLGEGKIEGLLNFKASFLIR